jgi:hypothetical protein
VRKPTIPAAIVLLLFLAFLPACANLSTEGGASPALGPDRPSASSNTATSSPSTLPERIRCGIAWLWASYTRLKTAGSLPGLDDLRADIVDLESVASRGDLLAALDLYARARARVTKIAEGM